MKQYQLKTGEIFDLEDVKGNYPKLIQKLLDLKIIEECKETHDTKYYVDRVAKKLGFSSYEQAAFSPIWINLFAREFGAFVDMLLKEVALDLDKKYPDHISKCETVYGISRVNYKVFPIKMKDITIMGLIPLFRSEEDAITALNIVKAPNSYEKTKPEN